MKIYERVMNEPVTLLKGGSFMIQNDKVEIIGEPNKIEKCKNYEDFLAIDDYIEHLKNKIDELIDEINNLKGND